MFIGSWIINVILSIIAFLFVFMGSMSSNFLATSFVRGCLAFVSFYLISYFFRWLWMLASKDVRSKELEKTEIEDKADGKDTTNEHEYTDEDIVKASNYLKDLIND